MSSFDGYFKNNNPFGLPGPEPRPSPHSDWKPGSIDKGGFPGHDWGLNPPQPWPQPGGDTKPTPDHGIGPTGSFTNWDITKF
jgi:hypothetical protein